MYLLFVCSTAVNVFIVLMQYYPERFYCMCMCVHVCMCVFVIGIERRGLHYQHHARTLVTYVHLICYVCIYVGVYMCRIHICVYTCLIRIYTCVHVSYVYMRVYMSYTYEYMRVYTSYTDNT